MEVPAKMEGVRRYDLLPRTTNRTTINLKTKNNQNFQKVKLQGSPTAKELKKKHSSRLLGGVETGTQAVRLERMPSKDLARQGSSWLTKRSHICMRIKWEEKLGRETENTTQGSSAGKLKPQNLGL